LHSVSLATLIASLTAGGVLAVGACLRSHPGRALAAMGAALHRPVLLSGAMTGRQIAGTPWHDGGHAPPPVTQPRSSPIPAVTSHHGVLPGAVLMPTFLTALRG
jgi:hypothetical protein